MRSSRSWRGSVGRGPCAERFVGIRASLFLALLHDRQARWRKVKRRRLKIQRTPVAIFDVLVITAAGKTGHQDVPNPGSSDVFEHATDVRIREMYEAVATQQYVTIGQ